MSPPGIKVVLDTTAVLAYPGDDVGELIREITDEGSLFGLPVVCLAAARTQTADPDQVRLLAKHSNCKILPVAAGDWERLARLMRLLGRVDCATARLAARVHRAYLVTADPDAYDDGTDGWALPIIGI